MSRTLSLFLIAIASAASCLDPTQVFVEITTDMPCGAGTTYPRLLGTEIKTGSSEADLQSRAQTNECRGANRVGSLVLVPGAGDQVYVEVTGRVAVSPTLTKDLKTSRIIRYLSHASLKLPIDLSSSCIDISCAPDETCSEGACIKKMTMGCRENCDAGRDADMDGFVPMKDSGSDAGKDINVSFDGTNNDVLISSDGTSFDAIADSGFDAFNNDAGPCPSLGMFNFHWGFNENAGSQTVQETVTKTQSTFFTAKTAQGAPPCGNYLLAPNVQNHVLKSCSGVNCWPGGLLKLAFGLRVNALQGLILGHGSGGKGSWALDIVQGNTLRFGVVYSSTPEYAYAQIPANKWVQVTALAATNSLSIQVDKVGQQVIVQGSSLPGESTYDVAIGSGSADFHIDELYISSQ